MKNTKKNNLLKVYYHITMIDCAIYLNKKGLLSYKRTDECYEKHMSKMADMGYVVEADVEV